MEDAVMVCFQLCLVLFSVLLGWAIYNVLDQYPCIHRFGRIWSEDKKSGIRNRRIMLFCWFSLVLIAMSCVYSLSQTHELFVKFGIYYNESGVLLYGILGLFSFIYFFIPYLINRFLWGLAIFVAPTDFRAYADDPGKREHWLARRFSEETISTLRKRPAFCGGIIAGNTGLVLVLLIFSPCIFLRFWEFFIACPEWTFVVLGLVVVFALLAYVPYSRWVP